ncbi:MAG: hypothetical protein H8E60_04015 [Candidatus Marinimicrobia bacterium]|nr:hypothetical protein [Candidatus Neomarinimicrobiota bacterium]
MKKITIIPLILGLVTFWGCEDNSTGSENNDDILTIEVSNNAFGEYPAVWFSPSTGDIVAVEDETPPESKYIYWIEPNDPEFATWLYGEDQDALGVKFIGIGEDFFQNTTSTSDSGFSQSLVNAQAEGNELATNSVYFLRDYDADCIIQILDWRQSEYYLKFKWKKL